MNSGSSHQCVQAVKEQLQEGGCVPSRSYRPTRDLTARRQVWAACLSAPSGITGRTEHPDYGNPCF